MAENKLVVLGTLPPELGSKNYGGVARVVWELVKKFNNYKHIRLTVLPLGKYFGGSKEVEGINICSINFSLTDMFSVVKLVINNYMIFQNNLFTNHLKLLYSLYLLLNNKYRLNNSIIHIHHITNQIPLALHILKMRVSVVVTIHSISELIRSKGVKKKNILNNINKQLKYTDFITFVSNSLREQAIDAGLEWNCKDKVIYNGISVDNFTIQLNGKMENNNINRICFVGELTVNKGVMEILNAMKYLDKEHYRLIWVGKGELENYIYKECERNAYQYTLKGYLNRDDLLREFIYTDLLVVPSKSESFGLVYIESLMVGTPIIGYHSVIREFRRILTKNETEQNWLTPFNVDKESPKSLSKKIKFASSLKKYDYRKKITKEIQSEIINNFNWDNISKEYINVYKNIV